MRPPLIYVVDDEEPVTKLLGIDLAREGYIVNTFQNPRLALEAFGSADPKPSLLIVDFQMPEMNGLELLQRCRALMPTLKSISISGHLSEPKLGCYGVRPDHRLHKSFTHQELLEVVSSVLAESPP